MLEKNFNYNRIGHDNKGLGPGWHLKEIQIETPHSKNKLIFPCNKWFDKKEGDGKIERDLFPIQSIKEKALKSHNFIGGLINFKCFANLTKFK